MEADLFASLPQNAGWLDLNQVEVVFPSVQNSESLGLVLPSMVSSLGRSEILLGYWMGFPNHGQAIRIGHRPLSCPLKRHYLHRRDN